MFRTKYLTAEKIPSPDLVISVREGQGFIVSILSVAVTLVEGAELSGIDVVLRTSVAAAFTKTNSEMV